MANTTVAADAVPPVPVPVGDATPSMRSAATSANRRRPRVAAKRSRWEASFPPETMALAIVSGLLGVVLGYALGRRRGKKPGETEEGAQTNPMRSLALTPPTSPGPTLASPARAKRSPVRRVFGAVWAPSSGSEESVLAERSDADANAASAAATSPTHPPKRASETSGWTLADFLAFAELKMGTLGGAVARWSVEGDVFEYPTGRLLARVAGVDVCRRVDDSREPARDTTPREQDENAPVTKTTQISRKLLLFLDPETGEVMTEFEGRAVAPAAFPYQMVEYAFSPSTRPAIGGGSVTATVTIGAGASKMTLTGASVAVSRGDAAARLSRDDAGAASRVFSVPAFLDVETADGGRHEAYESYDYFHGDLREGTSSTSGTSHEPVFVWTRFGACAPFGEACVVRALARRAASHEALPESVRRFVARDAPEFADAPRDLAEIRALQA